jgi:2-keto-4-pentenoate hydratase/2-oxohepta-3-ene-1,7-dioic acid hydratase in catechol pathway
VRIVRFETSSRSASYGLAEGDAIVPLADAPWATEGVPMPSGHPLERRAVTLLPPTVPSKILCIGRNYHAHAKELGNEVPKEPLVFFKPPSSLLPHGGTIVLPPESERVDYEGELALVVGRRARRVPRDAWRDVVFGVTASIDVTARDLQKKDGQWWRAKGFDTFCPIGPAIETEIDATALDLETYVDGQRRQAGNTRDFIFDIPTLIAWLSAAMTLEPGDVILTGTPEGVGPLVAGNRVEVVIAGVGRLAATVSTAVSTAESTAASAV